MLKKEIIWREILYQALEQKQYKFTQKALAQKFGFSLSTVFNALKIPRASGAIEVRGRFFEVVDKQKFLAIWSTHRHFSRDIIFQTRVDLPVLEMEGELPGSAIPTAYTAYRFKYGEAPADYDKVYVYAKDLAEIKQRFPVQAGRPNLIVLKPDDYLASYGARPPLAQIYVDLWNLNDWFAADFLQAMRDKQVF